VETGVQACGALHHAAVTSRYRCICERLPSSFVFATGSTCTASGKSIHVWRPSWRTGHTCREPWGSSSSHYYYRNPTRVSGRAVTKDTENRHPRPENRHRMTRGGRAPTPSAQRAAVCIENWGILWKYRLLQTIMHL
jgi:hypothetical protein